MSKVNIQIRLPKTTTR